MCLPLTVCMVFDCFMEYFKMIFLLLFHISSPLKGLIWSFKVSKESIPRDPNTKTKKVGTGVFLEG